MQFKKNNILLDMKSTSLQPLVSVVVPTYNRSHIWKRISGGGNLAYNLLNQDYPNYELIIVNDGSTDDTVTVLKELAGNNARIKVVNKQNAGASVARNEGIERAEGEYIFFVDDDDNIPTDYLSSFMSDEFNGIDLVIDSYSNQMGDAPAKAIDFPEKLLESRKEILDFVFGEMQKRAYCFFPFGKRYSQSILKENVIRFNPTICLGEDRPFVLDYIASANSCCFVNKHKYIVKSEYGTGYRMSQGLKPVNILWKNFKKNYAYLKDYEKRYSMEAIGRYADNYIVSKAIEYILLKVALGQYKDQPVQIKQVFDELQKMEIEKNNIRDKKTRTLFRILTIGGVLPAVMTIRGVLFLGRNIKRR